MNLPVISAITRKDVVDAIRHRYLLTALVTPLFVALIFRVILPGVDRKDILKIVVHNPGGSGLVGELTKIPQISVIEVTSSDAMAGEVERRKATGGLVVPPTFDADLAANKQPELSVYLNNQKNTFELAAFRRMMDQLVRSFAKQPEPARLVWIDVDKPNEMMRGGITLEQILLPLLLILTFGMTGAFVVPLLIVEEKEKRTLDFLLSSPATLNDIIAGKGLTGVIYTVLIAGLLLGINRQLVRNWPMTALTALLGLLFVVGVGLVVGSVLKNTMQVNTWASIVLIVLLVPTFPSLGMTAWFDTIMRFIPTYYLTEALKLSIAGTISSQLWVHLAVLVACTFIVFSAAGWALHRRS